MTTCVAIPTRTPANTTLPLPQRQRSTTSNSSARQRAKRLVENTIDLLMNHMVNPKYPGVVINLGGDMVSGDIHEELSATNEKEMMQ